MGKSKRLEEVVIHYEAIEFKPRRTMGKAEKTSKRAVYVVKTKSLLQKIKTFIATKFTVVKAYLADIVKKLRHPRKKTKKLTKKERDNALKDRNNAILGVGLLLVVVSIAYSTAVILIGVDSLESKIALIPQVVFALVILIKAFSKLYK